LGHHGGIRKKKDSENVEGWQYGKKIIHSFRLGSLLFHQAGICFLIIQ
jgi:hypothetical protein